LIDVTPYALDPSTLPAPISWPAIFGNGRPVEVEIGSGKGLFLANAATARPERNFLGIELAKKYARRAAERVAKKALANVRILPWDARRFMSVHCPSASLHAVHVYFPDPWWKTRHKKRRVFAEPLVIDIERTLISGGELHVATDVEEYFGVIRDLLATHPRFVEQALPGIKDPEHDLDYLTNFERKYRIEGRAIHRASYRLDGGRDR
jgi:tRNA (guanine-N7-)-methyltransferase